MMPARRIVSIAATYKWLLLTLVVLSAAALISSASIGPPGLQSSDSPWWHLERVYRVFIVLGLPHWWLAGNHAGPVLVARWMLVGATLFVIWQAWAAIFREQYRRLQLASLRDHAIVCGLGDKGALIAKSLRAKGIRVVAIDRAITESETAVWRSQGVIAIPGEASDPQILALARVGRARFVIAVCGSDATNAEIAARCATVAKARTARSRLRCFLHIRDLDLYRLLRDQEFAEERPPGFELDIFNVFELGAKVLLTSHPFGASDRSARLLIVGLGRFGASVLWHAVSQWHIDRAPAGNALRVTVVGAHAERHLADACARHPKLATMCELNAVSLSPREAEFERGEFLHGPSGTIDVTAVYVCEDEETTALSAALTLRQLLAGSGAPVIVRVANDDGFGALLRANPTTSGDGASLQLFGLLPRTCHLDLLLGGTHEMIARSIHADYVRQQRAEGGSPSDNPSMVEWDELPETLRESNRQQALDIGSKLAAIGCRLTPIASFDPSPFDFTETEIETLAEMEHVRWMKERRSDGWRFGPKKDLARKRSPYLVDWDQLSAEIKELDRSAVRAIPSLLAKAGFRLVRSRGVRAAEL